MISAFENLFLRMIVVFAAWLTTLVFCVGQGWFSANLVIVVTIAAAVGLVIFFLKTTPKVSWKKIELIALLVIIVICLGIGWRHHDLPLGRDPTSYSVAAIKITESGGLSFKDELARPFHGLSQIGKDTFTSQFLPGYNVYLAVFYLGGGLTGLNLANIPLLFLALAAIFIIARRLSSTGGGLAAVLLTGSFYATIWLGRRWTSELLMMTLILGAVACFVSGVRRRNLVWVLAGIFPAALTILVRGEGILYLFSYLLVAAIFTWWYRRELRLISIAWALLAFPLIVYITFQLYVLNFGGDYVYGQGEDIMGAIGGMLAKPAVLLGIILVALLALVIFGLRSYFRLRSRSWPRRFLWGLAGIIIIVAEICFWLWVQKTIPVIKWELYRVQFVLEVFSHYFLILFAAIIFIGFYKRIWPRLAYLVMLAAAPALVFVLDPYIALDHPWFLRRYVAVLFPLIFILAAVALARFKITRRVFTLVLIILVSINLAVSAPILWHRENDGMAAQLKDFADRFEPNDLVLMTPGWRWQQWAYYLHFFYGLQVLPSLEGFKDNQDLQTKLATCDNIYILSERSFSHHPLYSDDQLEFIGEIKFTYPEIQKSLWGLSQILEEMEGQTDVYYFRQAQSSLPPRDIITEETELQLFKVK